MKQEFYITHTHTHIINESGTLSDKRTKGLLYFQNTIRFRGTAVHVVPFTTI